MIDLKRELRESLKRRKERGEPVTIPKRPYHHEPLYPDSRKIVPPPDYSAPVQHQRWDRCHHCGAEVNTVRPEGEQVRCRPCRVLLREAAPKRRTHCAKCQKAMVTQTPEGVAVCCGQCGGRRA